MEGKKNRLDWIDGIRLAASLGIFWSHFHSVFITYSQTGAAQIGGPLMWVIKWGSLLLNGQFWVCTFCMASGFLAAGKRSNSPKELAMNLFTKYLRFAVSLCFMSLFVLLTSGLVNNHAMTYGEILQNQWLSGFSKQITAADVFRTIFLLKGDMACPLWMLPPLFGGICIVYIVSFYAKHTKTKNIILLALAAIWAAISYWQADFLYMAVVLAGALIANIVRKQPVIQKSAGCRLFRPFRDIPFSAYLLHWPVICSISLAIYGRLMDKMSYSAIYVANLILTTLIVIVLSGTFVLVFGRLGSMIVTRLRDALCRLISEKEMTTEKLQKVLFMTVFFVMIAVPLLKVNLKPNGISLDENRKLNPQAKLYDEQGNLNTEFFTDFEEWFKDNLGYRSNMVLANARIQFYVFQQLSVWNSSFALGPKGELNHLGSIIIPEYQHLNLLSEEELEQIASAFQTVSDYLESKGISFYYVQNWDKQSIYPEQFPTSIIQYGDVSMTDQVIEKLMSSTTVNVISLKDAMIAGKEKYETYSTWGDPLHWTDRGAYLGYLEIMNTLNQNSDIQYKILNESDYFITTHDLGATLFGGIHKENMLEVFEILYPEAYRTDWKLTLYEETDPRNSCWTNDSVDNDTRLLILGDSYFESFIMDDFAESFHETILLWQILMESELVPIVEEYQPDIVIFEKAEREAAFEYVINAAEIIKALN